MPQTDIQPHSNKPPAMKRIIWMLWLQGWDNAPELIRACAASWAHHNPGWQLKLISAKGLKRYAPDAAAFSASQDIQAPALSDIVRLELLERHSGVWADATVYCTRPLDDWIEKGTSNGFFAFHRPALDRMISSWFLAARPGSYIVQTMRQRAGAYWRGREEADEYFWFHRLFDLLYETHQPFKNNWDGTPKFPAILPHYFAPYNKKMFHPLSKKDQQTIDTGRTFVLKLTHRLKPELVQAAQNNTPYRWLIDRTIDWPESKQLEMALKRLRLPPK